MVDRLVIQHFRLILYKKLILLHKIRKVLSSFSKLTEILIPFSKDELAYISVGLNFELRTERSRKCNGFAGNINLSQIFCLLFCF